MVSKPTGVIATAWQSYLASVIPPDASDVQKLESRLAFYAGAAALWKGLMTVLESGAEPTEADLALMESIQTELTDFWCFAQAKAEEA